MKPKANPEILIDPNYINIKSKTAENAGLMACLVTRQKNFHEVVYLMRQLIL